ncbi:MAG: hypothetical protein FJZ38_25910, partial [Candidatus Rokubacteria bacterium]|nr:hypothetical protein [Candidatus Rokubacteria bacterium]
MTASATRRGTSGATGAGPASSPASTAIATAFRSATRRRKDRVERDSLGLKRVPAAALYGVFTQRARETFDLSGRAPHPALLRAYARVKRAAAVANGRLGLLPASWARAIVQAADRVIAGEIADVAVLDA